MTLKLSFIIFLLMLLHNAVTAQMIYSCTDLQNMNNNLAGNYALANSIDCSATASWNAGAGFSPIGPEASPFTGTLDGGGHTINALTIKRPSTWDIGLFGRVSANANIIRLGLTGVAITGELQVGGLTGTNEGGTITNCYVTGSVSGSNSVGGLVGYNGGTITNCYTSSNVSPGNYLGGLVGYNGGTITHSYATGSISGSPYTIGGLVGNNFGTISHCYASSTVLESNTVSGVGGLVGDNSGTISSSYATGSVSGSASVGGLVGSNGGTITNSYATNNVLGSGQAGGLAGSNTGIITQSYATGAVSASSGAGGLVGSGTGGAYSSYWNTQTSGQAVSVGGMGKSTSQLYQNATFLNWNFTCVWSINEGKGTPQLTQNDCAPRPFVSFQIKNCKELQLAVLWYTAYITLTQDIDCTESATWNNGAGFYSGLLTSGIFDGSGHRIVNLSIHQTTIIQVGLFGKIALGAEIQNVIMEQTVIVGGTYVGSLVGYNLGIIMRSSASGSVSGSNTVGGLVGYNNQGTIINSYATSTVSGSSIAGGLVGENYGSITQCYATGSISGSSNVGGLAGTNYQNRGSGSVPSTITNCYAAGSVSGSSVVGGLVGTNSANILTSYAIGKVTSGGGLVGSFTSIDGGVITSTYWNIQTSTQAASSGGIGLTTQAMQQLSSFTGWDFTTTWFINSGYTYPLLQVFVLPPVLSQPLNNITQYIGTSLQFTIPANTFIDPNGLHLVYSAELEDGYPLPAWLLFKPSVQTFASIPLSGAQGTLFIQVSVYNLPTQLTSCVWQLTIPDRAPVINAPFAQQVALNGQPFQFIIPDATFLDADGDHLQLMATEANQVSLPAWLSFNAPLGIFSGTAKKRGTTWINVTTNDGYGGQVSALFEIVTPNTPPQTTGTFPNQVLIINQPFNFTIPTSLFFDLDGDSLMYSANLFGGGSLLPWLSFNVQTSTFQGVPNVLGFVMVSVTATDPFNATAALNFGVSVSDLSNNSPPLLAIQMLDQTATINEPFELALPDNMFVDPEGYPLTYSAMLEGGAPLPSWLVFNATWRLFSGVPTNTGNFYITVRADDGAGGFALDTFTLTVQANLNYPPIVLNTIPNQIATVDQAYRFGIPTDTFYDPRGNLLSYAAHQGGNQPLPPWLQFDSKTLLLSGTPRPEDTGTFSTKAYRIEIIASNGIGSTSATFDLFVQGDSTVASLLKIFGPIATILSICATIYAKRALLWNHSCMRWYRLPRQAAVVNQLYQWSINIDEDRIKNIQAFRHRKALKSNKLLPDWLSHQIKQHQLTGTSSQDDMGTLIIRIYGYDERILAEFELGIFQSQGEADNFVAVPKPSKKEKLFMLRLFSRQSDSMKENLIEMT